jgi:cellulose synthase/poly-beta-1,6-N-acetylglucosamine synthase-like glycosyltransferase
MNLPILHIILLLIVFVYTIITIVTITGIRKKTRSISYEEPFVSIIVVARNEEFVLKKCLDSLANLDYPNEKREFILVNDRSEDTTGKLMADFSKKILETQIITIDKDPCPYTGKTNGLIKAAKSSKGDILIFTDGDCEVPRKWIKTLVRQYDSNTGMVGGFLLLDKEGEKQPLFSRIQTLDWIYITSVGFAWANLGHPLSIFGNNLTIRKNVYEKIGGFEALGKHLIEDFALMRNMVNKTKYKVCLSLDSNDAVYTQPVKNLKEFYQQRKRWALGGRSHGLLAFILMGTTFSAHLIIPLLFVSRYLITGILGFIIFLILDFLILFYPLKILKRLNLVKYFLLFEFYYFIYTLIFAPVLLFARKVKWKSISYGR